MKSNYKSRYSNFIDDHREARFATAQEVMDCTKKIDLSKTNYTAAGLPVISDTETMYVDDSDNHSIIFGATRSGKTRRYIRPMLHTVIRAGHNAAVTDPKGELYDEFSGVAKKNGYRVILLDFRFFERGDQWNPLTQPKRLYDAGQQDQAVNMTTDLMNGLADPQAHSSGDIFWVEMAKCLGNAIFQIMLECYEPEYCNMSNFAYLCSEKCHEEMEAFAAFLPEDVPASLNLSGVYSSAEKTRQSIEVSLYGMIQDFTTNAKLMNMLQESTFDMQAIAREKTIIFIQIADEKSTYYTLVSLFLKQLDEILIEEAQKTADHRLPIPMEFILDEFCNIPAIPNFENRIAAAGSRNIRYHMVVQSNHQLKQKYGDHAETIKGNAQNWVFLTSRELSLLNDISELSGNVVTRTGKNRPLLSVSELQRFDKDKGETLIFCQRLYPFITYMPDIGEYSCFKSEPPLDSRYIKMAPPKIKDFHELISDVKYGNFPVPFANDIPACVLMQQILDEEFGTDEEILNKLNRGESRPEELSQIQKDLMNKFDELFGSVDDEDSDYPF